MQKYISSCYTLNYTIYKHFTSNIAEKKAHELYNCELYNCSKIQFFLGLYNRSVYIVFLFLYKAREKHIFSCYTLNIAAKQVVNYTIVHYTIALKQDSELYNCSEIDQRIIHLYMYSELYNFYVCCGAQLCKVCYNIQI